MPVRKRAATQDFTTETHQGECFSCSKKHLGLKENIRTNKCSRGFWNLKFFCHFVCRESGLEQAHVLGCNDAQPSSSLHNDLSPSPSVLSLIKQKIKTRLARRRDEIQGRGLVQHQLDADSVVSSNAATKDSSSSSDGQLSSSASDIDDPVCSDEQLVLCERIKL